MKFVCFLIVLISMMMPFSSVAAQGNNNDNTILLYQYLIKEGRTNHWHFTIEDSDHLTHFHSILWDVPIIDKNISFSDELITYLKQQLPGVTVSMTYKNVISLTATSLLYDKNYVLNKTIACTYQGTNPGLWYYLNPLLDNRLSLFRVSMQYGHLLHLVNIPLSIHTKSSTIRSIFTIYLPLDQSPVILWTAFTYDANGKELTEFQPADANTF